MGNVLPQFSGGVAVADQVLVAGVTAVIAYIDVIALGLLSRFNAHEVGVPDRLSLIGVDGIAMSMVHPSLTTIALDTEASGWAGVDLLLHQLAIRSRPGRPGTSSRRT